MIERILVLGAFALLVAMLALAGRRWANRRAGALRLTDQQALWTAIGQGPDGRAAVVTFSTPACVTCRTVQEPALQQVALGFGASLRLIHVDIGESPGAARAFKVLTAPSTAVFDVEGRLQHLNQGFASAELLQAQVSAAGGVPGSARSPRRPARRAPGEPAPAARR